MNDLSKKRCLPCEGGIPALNEEETGKLIRELKGWEVIDNMKLKKEYNFINFKHNMEFVNKIAALAELEKHHPDLIISYAKLRIEIYTHAINGLSENDFILASKIDLL